MPLLLCVFVHFLGFGKAFWSYIQNREENKRKANEKRDFSAIKEKLEFDEKYGYFHEKDDTGKKYCPKCLHEKRELMQLIANRRAIRCPVCDTIYVTFKQPMKLR